MRVDVIIDGLDLRDFGGVICWWVCSLVVLTAILHAAAGVAAVSVAADVGFEGVSAWLYTEFLECYIGCQRLAGCWQDSSETCKLKPVRTCCARRV
jgi:hypothetical protein